jgi:hypothetical protein
MSADRKLEILRSVEGSGVRVAEALSRLEISPSTQIPPKLSSRISFCSSTVRFPLV